MTINESHFKRFSSLSPSEQDMRGDTFTIGKVGLTEVLKDIGDYNVM